MGKKSGRKMQKKPSKGRNGPAGGGGGGGEKKAALSPPSRVPSWIPSAAAALAAVAVAGYMGRKVGQADMATTAVANVTSDVSSQSPIVVKQSVREAPAGTTASQKRESIFSAPPPLLEPPHEASIAAFHTPSEGGPDVPSEDLARYLMYDDGYTACLVEEAVESDRFGVRDVKRAKWTILREWSNVAERWVALLPATSRSGGGKQAKSGEMAEASLAIESTCRLITLNHDDYGGRAASVLREVIANGTDAVRDFYLSEPQGHSSEYRTMACLSRFLEASSSASSSGGRVAGSSTAERNARDRLRSLWAARAMKAKEKAEAELLEPTRLPLGWQEKRDEKSGYTFYYDPSTKKTTWIRPVVSEEKGRTSDHTPPGPNEDGKIRHSSMTVRNQPCDAENTMKFSD